MQNEELRPLSIPNYFVVDIKVLQDKRLIPFDVVLYSLISGLANNEKNCCYSGNLYISEFLGVTIRNIQKSLKRLEKLGYIKIEIIGGNKRTIKTYMNIALELREKKMRELNDRLKQRGKLDLVNYDWLNEEVQDDQNYR